MATRTKYDAELRVHKDWLSLLQPVGLVVSPPALKAAQATPNTNVIAEQQRLLRLALPPTDKGQSDWVSTQTAENACISHFPTFSQEILEWRASDLIDKPAELAVAVLDHDDVLQPSWGVKAEDGSWLLLVREETPFGKDLDVVHEVNGQEWEATPQARFERLLRETKVPIGILTNGTHLRLVYAPPGESSGHVTFPVAALCRVAGRPILSALLMLLGASRLWMKPEKERLPFILKESRKYQAQVTTKLADQVLDALRELLNGFQSAHVASNGLLLQEMLTSRAARQEIYGGMLASILRCVFVLYAEDRGLMPQHETYLKGYALTKLFEKLREDAALYPDTMDQRYGAWTQLLALFRVIFDGAEHGPLSMPAREGKLFNPDTYPFLEGRPYRSRRVIGDREKPPRVSDGVVYRVLEKLLILEGERLSYRALDVEQIGSVYEALMGFELEVAHGASIACKPKHVVVDLDAILKAKPSEREEILKKAELKAIPKDVKGAKTVDELVHALDRVLSPRTPGVIPLGAMYLQPGEERRRSGSHYTPRALTEPVVATTLRPIFESLGARPKPADILALKICDPAMGSGAFLVEACRQLADKLVDAWNQRPLEKPNFKGEEMVLRARREVAQRCLYGVDKNPFAVDLAKLSLWLATLAKDHPFTFLDHSLKCGDSLIGLTREQIADVAWPGVKQLSIARSFVETRLEEALDSRRGIFALGDSDDVHQKQRYLRDAEAALDDIRLVGDAVISTFTSADNEKSRKADLEALRSATQQWFDGTISRDKIMELAERVYTFVERPFHWEIEFPEVFVDGGFNVIIGNPPFLAGMRISTAFSGSYLGWLYLDAPGSGSRADLVSYFFRKAWRLLRGSATLGFISTHTIAYGDTRNAALVPIRKAGGKIYYVTRPETWTGSAAVMTRTLAIAKGFVPTNVVLNGRPVSEITAFLAREGPDEDPQTLQENARVGHSGIYVYGDGLLFADDNADATPLSVAHAILEAHPDYGSIIKPYIGGDEVLSDPEQRSRRYAIDLGQLSEDVAEDRWPLVMEIARSKSRPSRAKVTRKTYRERWWQFAEQQPALRAAIVGKRRLLMHPFTATHPSFVFVDANVIVGLPHAVIALESDADFAVLQSRVHEAWTRFCGSSMDQRLRYPVSDVFVTFARPRAGEPASERLRTIGGAYYSHRASICRSQQLGLTETYNRFHDPDERDAAILHLRELTDQMDLAVLDAYGWTDIQPTCTFRLDYEEDDDDDDDDGGKRKKKKPWRYRWPDDIRDEVLARLMKLNAERYAEQQRIGVDKQLVAAAVKTEIDANEKPAKKKATRAKKKTADVPSLFDAPRAEAGDE